MLSAKPSVAETASKGDWLMAAIGEDEGDGGDNGGELQLSRNNPISRNVSTCIAEGEYGGLDSVLSTVGVCAGIGSGTLGSPNVPHACEHRHPGGVCVWPCP